MYRPLSALKQRVVPSGSAPHTIRAGLFRGIQMNLDLRSQSQIYLGLFEQETHIWLKRLSAGIATAIDIGAAAGEYTLYFLTKTPARRVLAFEPDSAHHAELRTNLRLNGLDHDPRVALLAACVGSSPGAMPLDDFLPLSAPPCLVKMDVDGAELDILRSANSLLGQPDVRWLIETHSAELERECMALLHATGYKTVVVPNAWWRMIVPEQRPLDHNRWLVAMRS